MAYKKIKSFKKLESMGLNTHQWKVPTCLSELIEYIHEEDMVTIRWDSYDESQDKLPFRILESSKTSFIDAEEIWRDSIMRDCVLIVANGVKYDPIQLFNASCRLERDGNFLIEAGIAKVPQRNMYEYPTLCLLGNINDRFQSLQVFGDSHMVDKRLLRECVLKMYELELFDKYVEFTMYPVEVGKLNQTIVYWQMSKGRILC